MFHQIEGLYIDKNVNMSHLKGCILDFCREYFDIEDLPVRFRPSFFPLLNHQQKSILVVIKIKMKLKLELVEIG